MNKHNSINYIEIPARQLKETKEFFTRCFGWEFTDYGPEYSAITNGGIDGGFFQTNRIAQTENGSVLVVLYSENLEQSLVDVEQSGGTITNPIFSFPGGRRFHFCDPSGNEFAVWSE